MASERPTNGRRPSVGPDADAEGSASLQRTPKAGWRQLCEPTASWLRTAKRRGRRSAAVAHAAKTHNSAANLSMSQMAAAAIGPGAAPAQGRDFPPPTSHARTAPQPRRRRCYYHCHYYRRGGSSSCSSGPSRTGGGARLPGRLQPAGACAQRAMSCDSGRATGRWAEGSVGPWRGSTLAPAPGGGSWR